MNGPIHEVPRSRPVRAKRATSPSSSSRGRQMGNLVTSIVRDSRALRISGLGAF